MTITDSNDTDAAALRERMLDALIERGHLRSPRVLTAMRAVPRHVFLPGASVAEAYEDTHVVTKYGPAGEALSSASAPWIVADMLADLDVLPGHRVLEIGAGTGYNAALLAELVGPEGTVTSIDIDPEVTCGATTILHDLGYTPVTVVTGDGFLGVPDRAPYDRIVATVGCWDMPIAWWDQLADPGRLVVPLRWRGDSRVLAFAREGDRMTADANRMGGFIPIRGHDDSRDFAFGPDGAITLTHDPDQDITPVELAGVFGGARAEEWTGVTVAPNEPWDAMWLHLASFEPGACRLTTFRTAIDAGGPPAGLMGMTRALAKGRSLAYFTFRFLEGPDRIAELGAIGYGPEGAVLAGRIGDRIRAWSSDRNAIPIIHAWRGTPRDGGVVIPKPQTSLTALPH